MASPVSILLVDDEPRNLDALEAVLSQPEYELLRAGDADSALRLLLDHDVAAIVLDIKMPGVSGFELARMIKNTKRFRETPIVFLSAYLVDDQDVIAGYGAGGVDYLTKPLNPQILRQKVAVFVDLFKKTRELASVNAELASLNEKLEERVAARTEELQKSEAALRQASAQKDEFLAVLAHELRNPLAPLRTGLDLLLRYQAGTPAGASTKTLAAMNRQLDHMVRLIDDLLDVSRISRGLLELKRGAVDLVPLVRATVDSARPWFDRRGHQLTADVPEELMAYADATRVAQILTNLLHNAAKFTADGGSVHVALTAVGDRAHLSVIDSGTGIRADQLDRVFDMFARIERPKVSTEPGLGIGLALGRRLAEMHGGSLTVSSAGEGHGTTFTLDIPAGGAPSSPSASTGPVAEREVGAALRIVLVEDNHDIAEVLEEWLKDLGHEVTVAYTGTSGIEAIRSKQPTLVVCDLGLPDIPGVEVCRAVRAFPPDNQPIMVALTGWGRPEDLRLTQDAGFNHHLVKPVAPEALQSLLATVGKEQTAAAPAL